MRVMVAVGGPPTGLEAQLSGLCLLLAFLPLQFANVDGIAAHPRTPGAALATLTALAASTSGGGYRLVIRFGIRLAVDPHPDGPCAIAHATTAHATNIAVAGRTVRRPPKNGWHPLLLLSATTGIGTTAFVVVVHIHLQLRSKVGPGADAALVGEQPAVPMAGGVAGKVDVVRRLRR